MPLKFKIIQHKNLVSEELNAICFLKDENWSYGIKNQKKWIRENINKNDFHLLCYETELVGYMNLVHRKIILDDKDIYEVLGVGNVCISKMSQGLGFGRVLVKENNKILIDKNETGILLCKTELIKFYKKNGWILADDTKLKGDLKLMNVNLMTFNLNNDFDRIEFIGAPF